MNAALLRAVRLLACGCVASGLAACTAPEVAAPVAGNAEDGRLLLEQFDCGRCHVIPGVRAAQGELGPTLERYAHHVYIAGEVPNEPALLLRWIQQPSALVPDTLMPDQGVSAAQAQDMAAYLLDLR